MNIKIQKGFKKGIILVSLLVSSTYFQFNQFNQS